MGFPINTKRGEGKYSRQQVEFPPNCEDDDGGGGDNGDQTQYQQQTESCINSLNKNLSGPDLAGSAPFVIRPHSTKGRAVFATRRLSANTLLLGTGPPEAYTLNKPYRREVCARCFAYDRGVNWKIRLEPSAVENLQIQATCSKPSPGSGSGLGLVFCTEICREEWILRQGELGMLAWMAVWEIGSRRQGRKQPDILDGGVMGEAVDGFVSIRPTAEEIESAWADVEDRGCRQAREIRMRVSEEQLKLTKVEKKLLIRLQNIQPAPSMETLSFLVSGVLTHYMLHFDPDRNREDEKKKESDDDWRRIEDLAADSTPYASVEDLQDCVNAYQTLLILLPVTLLPSLTVKTVQTLQNAASHNSFSIRPSLNSGAYNAEFLGWGLWASASIWNHSCAPNVSKKRVGEGWAFVVNAEANGGKGVEAGDELCISYLSGEEKELGWENRRVKLRESWGFDCHCELCAGTDE